MRVFVTGATGFVGKAVVQDLIANGHQVVGLSRSDAGEAKLRELGATPLRGDLADVELLKSASKDADAVIHLGFIHDFSNFAKSLKVDRDAIDAMTSVLQGKVFVGTQGTMVVARSDRPGLETDEPDPKLFAYARAVNEIAVVNTAANGVKCAVVRLAPTVHGTNDWAFVPALIGMAKQNGYSAYANTGEHRWPAVHLLDAARLYRLAIEKLADGTLRPGSRLHGVSESGIPTKDIAQAIATKLNFTEKPVSRPPEHFGFLSEFFSTDNPISNDLTRQWTGWQPKEVGLIEDIRLNY